MPRVLLSASFPEELLIRQTPEGSGRWEDIEYLTESSDDPLDAWVVYDDLRRIQVQNCNPQNTLLITGEPECLRRYRTRFTSQFGQVWTSHLTVKHPHMVNRNEAQHWHYAMRPGQTHGKQLGFDELCELPRPKKTKLLSVLCSSKTHSHDHRQRLRFVEVLKQELGPEVDVFGRGIRSIEDKSDAIYDYKYHVVLENDHSEYFMTEKLADAFLGWSYPLYFGGPEAYHRYPEGSFTAINIYRPDEAMSVIRTTIAGDTYESSLDQIAAARQYVLYKNNMFAMLSAHWREQLHAGEAKPVMLLPKKQRTGLVLRQMRRALAKSIPGRAA